MLSEVKENTPRMNEKIINLRREKRNIKMSQKENLEWKHVSPKNIQIWEKKKQREQVENKQ